MDGGRRLFHAVLAVLVLVTLAALAFLVFVVWELESREAVRAPDSCTLMLRSARNPLTCAPRAVYEFPRGS